MQGRECAHCGSAIHPALDPVRVVANQVVVICRSCGRQADGCAPGDERVDDHVDPGDAARDRPGQVPRRYLVAAGTVAMAAIALAGVQSPDSRPAPASIAGAAAWSVASDQTDRDDDDANEAGETGEMLDPSEGIEPGPQPVIEDLPVEELLDDGSEPLHERIPSLADWVHPVAGTDELIPRSGSRRFGAERLGVRRTECGAGHCGVDLGGPRGTPILAVAWGVVVRVEHRADRTSGKYVKLRHPEGAETAYMHLDDISEGLRVGDEVEPGQMLGTLGRTGIKNSAPHLHFALDVPSGGRMLYIDPVPYLRIASVLPEPVE